jgi:hypothetical protein
MLDRGMIRETAPDEAIEKVAKEIVEAVPPARKWWRFRPSIGSVKPSRSASMICMSSDGA